MNTTAISGYFHFATAARQRYYICNWINKSDLYAGRALSPPHAENNAASRKNSIAADIVRFVGPSYGPPFENEKST